MAKELQEYRQRTQRLRRNTPKFEAAQKRQIERERVRLKKLEARKESPPRLNSVSPSRGRSVPLSTPPRKQSLRNSVKALPPPTIQPKKIKNPGYRLYENGMEMEMMKREWTKSQRAYQQQQEENHTFRPSITKYAETVDRESTFNRKRPPKTPAVTSRDLEVIECTFQPNLMRRGAEGWQPLDPNAHERLFDDAQERVQRSEEMRSLQQAIRSSHLPDQLRQPAVKVGSYETEKWLERLVYSSVHQQAALDKIRNEATKRARMNSVPNRNRRSLSVPAPSDERTRSFSRRREGYSNDFQQGDVGAHISDVSKALANEKKSRDLKDLYQEVQQEVNQQMVTVADLISYCKDNSSKEPFYEFVLRDLISKKLPNSQTLYESDLVSLLSKSTCGPKRRMRGSRTEQASNDVVISDKTRNLAVNKKIKELTELYHSIVDANTGPPTVSDILLYCWERRQTDPFYQTILSDLRSKRLPETHLLTKSDFVAILQTTTTSGPKHKKRSVSAPRRLGVLDSLTEDCTFKPRILDYKPPEGDVPHKVPNTSEEKDTQKQLLQKSKVDILDRLRAIIVTSKKGH
eukprot:TRINITY_DN1748_c1_g1_i1.p1 TRINITY_DN1748_c1_g1~~TRINITY_DN1748_c1_g1_i1.p1  ORF type:complete len:645 (+),score=133.35 TRINITY_DN1748_c1_g1_i1:213-1937(+)